MSCKLSSFIHSFTHTQKKQAIHNSQSLFKPGLLGLLGLYCTDCIHKRHQTSLQNQNPESGLIKRAENAKARNTIPPIIVTAEIKEKKHTINNQIMFRKKNKNTA